MARIIEGHFIHSQTKDKLEAIENGLVAVDDKGKIAWIGKQKDWASSPVASSFTNAKKEVFQDGSKFICPGFVDTHTHAPQFPNSGIGLDMELLAWLDKYTFPTESKYENVAFATKQYQQSVKAHARAGTTTCVYFATIHTDAALALAKIIKDVGQRAFIGKVNMDRNSPDFYIEKSAEASLAETKRFIEGIRSMDTEQPTIHPIITPRFVPTCTPELMKGLTALAKEHDLAIQSHISENLGEIAWVKELHPESKHYADAYDQFGLLTDKTIMAHGIFMLNEELELFAKRGTTISHCPNSNFSLKSGILNIRRALDAGVDVALGTDVSGGYSPSMLDAIRQTMIASRATFFAHRDTTNVEEEVRGVLAGKFPDTSKCPPLLSFDEVFYLATLAGAKAVGLDKVTGNFEVGKEFDAIFVDLADIPHSPEDDTMQDKLQRFLLCGDDRQIVKSMVQGKSMKQ